MDESSPGAAAMERGEWTSQARVWARGAWLDWRVREATNGTGDCRMKDGRVVPVPVVPVPVETPPFDVKLTLLTR